MFSPTGSIGMTGEISPKEAPPRKIKLTIEVNEGDKERLQAVAERFNILQKTGPEAGNGSISKLAQYIAGGYFHLSGIVPQDNDLDQLDPEELAWTKVPPSHVQFFVAHYRQDLGHEGEFAGLVCRTCNRWFDSGHKSDCPVPHL